MTLAAPGCPGRRGWHPVSRAAVSAPDNLACYGSIIPPSQRRCRPFTAPPASLSVKKAQLINAPEPPFCTGTAPSFRSVRGVQNGIFCRVAFLLANARRSSAVETIAPDRKRHESGLRDRRASSSGPRRWLEAARTSVISWDRARHRHSRFRARGQPRRLRATIAGQSPSSATRWQAAESSRLGLGTVLPHRQPGFMPIASSHPPKGDSCLARTIIVSLRD